MEGERMDTSQQSAAGSANMIQLSITRNYAPHWKTWEGVREMVQNWHDGLYTCAPSTGYRDHLHYSKKSKETSASDGGKQSTYYVASHDQHEGEIGQLYYDPSNGSLTMINKNTALHRRCLLLGYTSKKDANRMEEGWDHMRDPIIGQFGEGMKIGALALLREERHVCVRTSKDSWRFGLREHDVLQEEVLTVFVTSRRDGVGESVEFEDVTPPCNFFKLEEGDTCTQVWPLTVQEWNDCAKRFLFLEQAKECVDTELGTLLLDDGLRGDLYMKKVWIQNMTEEGLHSGLNLSELRLNRDRNSVMRKSDVEHMASCIWSKSVKQKRDLSPRYYKLLFDGTSCDVKHAAKYVEEKDTAILIHDELIKEHGKHAFPVPNNTPPEHLHVLRQDPTKQLVLCNKNLMDILYKTGLVPDLQREVTLLEQQKEKYIPPIELNEEERTILDQVIQMVHLVEPDFTRDCISIVASDRPDLAFSETSVDLPRWMLQTQQIHAKKIACKVANCMCAVVWLCTKILNYWQGGNTNTIARHTMLTSQLAAQACSKVKSTDHEISIKDDNQQKSLTDVERELVNKRAVELDRTKQELIRKFGEARNQNLKEMENLQSQLKEVQEAYDEDKEHFGEKSDQLLEKFCTEQGQDKNKYESIMQMKSREHIELQKKKEEMEQELKEAKFDRDRLDTLRTNPESYKLQSKSNEQETKQFVNRLFDKVQELDKILQAKDGVKENSALQNVLSKLSQEFKESEKNSNCCLCEKKQRDRNCVLSPCGHSNFCMDCAEHLQKEHGTCLICRKKFNKIVRIEHFSTST